MMEGAPGMNYAGRGNWYALYVKSRHEFVAEQECRRRGVETFLPAVRRLRRWKDREKFVEFPMFPGYLFVNVSPDPETFLDVLKARGVVTFISLEPGAPTPVPQEEIRSLKLLIESGEEIDMYPNLAQGSRVRVKRGPLKGAEGVLRKKEEKYLFLLNIELLGRSLGVRVYADDVEAG